MNLRLFYSLFEVRSWVLLDVELLNTGVVYPVNVSIPGRQVMNSRTPSDRGPHVGTLQVRWRDLGPPETGR